MTCGILARRLLIWGPRIPTSQAKASSTYAYSYISATKKQDTPLSQFKLVSLQPLHHIEIIATYSNNTYLKARYDMNIITYVLLLHPGDYTGSKSEITSFQIEGIIFSCR